MSATTTARRSQMDEVSWQWSHVLHNKPDALQYFTGVQSFRHLTASGYGQQRSLIGQAIKSQQPVITCPVNELTDSSRAEI